MSSHTRTKKRKAQKPQRQMFYYNLTWNCTGFEELFDGWKSAWRKNAGSIAILFDVLVDVLNFNGWFVVDEGLAVVLRRD
jgi:hypothetical protein